jgi:hypothetical protein
MNTGSLGLAFDLDKNDYSNIELSLLLNSADKLVNQKCHAISILHTEGLVPHQGIYDESLVAQRDFPDILTLALAWKFTNDRRYLSVANRWIGSWVKIYVPNFDPLDESNFDTFIFACVILGDSLSEENRDMCSKLFYTWANGYLDGKGRRDYPETYKVTSNNNNWESHRVKIVALCSAALNDQALFSKAKMMYINQIEQNFLPDSSTLDYWDRDALHYVTYDLQPLVVACLAAYSMNSDWFDIENLKGIGLRNTLDWLVPYANEEKRHLEFAKTHAKFDLFRKSVGMNGFQGYWEPNTSNELFWMASFLDSKWAGLASRLDEKAPVRIWVRFCKRSQKEHIRN